MVWLNVYIIGAIIGSIIGAILYVIARKDSSTDPLEYTVSMLILMVVFGVGWPLILPAVVYLLLSGKS